MATIPATYQKNHCAPALPTWRATAPCTILPAVPPPNIGFAISGVGKAHSPGARAWGGNGSRLHDAANGCCEAGDRAGSAKTR